MINRSLIKRILDVIFSIILIIILSPIFLFVSICIKIDELPQLINILKGDMSFVGPRPERPELMADILKELPEFSIRLEVKAGLTGYAQIKGNYYSTPIEKLKWDMEYIENYSISFDIKIILGTIPAIFKI